MKPKKIFNQDSTERFEDAKIMNGNPNGIINYNRTPHDWARELYKKMLARTWFTEQINISKDKINYIKLTPEQKRAYDLVLAQLITNDSIQTNQLMDKINSFITSPVVNAALSRQSYEESLHSESYAVMAEDIAQDTDRIYNMHHEDEELRLKNYAVQRLYDRVYQEGKEITNIDVLTAFAANQILEGLVFPGGFVIFFSLDNVMPGSGEILKEINS